MAGPASLKGLGLALGLVLVLHAVALQWLAQLRAPLGALKTMAPPMLTRILEPEAPVEVAKPPPPPKPRVRRPAFAAAPVRAASAPESVASAPAQAAAPAPEPQVAAAEPPAVAAPEPAASAAAPAASAPADPLGTWPADTRLSYQLSGQFRSGPLYGDAQVLWQRDAARYQVRVDVDVTVWARLVMTSQGEVTPEGLVPRAYEELRSGRRPRAATLGEDTLSFENGKTAPRPPGVQDAASQFVELAHRFATGRERLEVGRSITLWMARPGAVDLWTYDVVEREMLDLPQMGPIETFRLKPRPIANPRGNITAEMWFAPSLRYLPVRVKIAMGDEAWLDLLVDRIELK